MNNVDTHSAMEAGEAGKLVAAVKALERATDLAATDAELAEGRLHVALVRVKLGQYSEALGTRHRNSRRLRQK